MAGRPDSGELVEAEAPAPRQRSRRALTILGSTALGVLAIDQLTKQLVLARLDEGHPVRLLGGAVYLSLTRNSGAAFSIGVGYTAIFPIISVAVVTGIVLLARQLRSLPWALAMGLILGGALGNLTDRLFRAPGPFVGHVVDFISVFDEAGRKFPIFNAADSALVCGVILAVLLELTGRRRDGVRVRHSDRGEH
ncbi:MAG: signal peptidase II [Micromonosporaceae bacterium]